MAKKIDLSAVSEKEAARLLRNREAKKDEYRRRKDTLLARTAAWRKANPEKERADQVAWRAANPEKCAAGKSQWYAQNRELQLSRAAARNNALADSVVKSLYCAKNELLQSQDIPDELVPAIRLSILIKRELKEQKRELRRTNQ